jgi:ribosome-binding protein aMBF1 (putative translation factor)
MKSFRRSSLDFVKRLGFIEASRHTRAKTKARLIVFISCDMKQVKRALTGAQIRAARALVRWSAEDLARESAVSVATIRRAELADRATPMTTANELSVRRALESAGVEFIPDNGGGPGVRLRERS